MQASEGECLLREAHGSTGSVLDPRRGWIAVGQEKHMISLGPPAGCV